MYNKKISSNAHVHVLLFMNQYKPFQTLETSRVDTMADARAGKHVRETKNTKPAPKLSSQICQKQRMAFCSDTGSL